MQEQITTLESQLQEKEQLVAALTERLEQAAEQLDRLHRSGADRAMRVGGGIPPELVEEQKQLVEELQQAVQQWEDMQPGALLGRLEIQITEIRDMLAGQFDGAYALMASSERSPRESERSTREEESPRRRRDGESRSPASGSAAYEAIKAGLLGDDPPAEHDDEQETEARDGEQAEETTSTEPTGPEYEETLLADPPASIDVANAGVEELRHAVEERDSYILYLLQRLRNAESRPVVRNNWSVLENVPAELRVRLEVLEKQLEQTLRTAEVELSLQRAKLGREEARIRLLDEHVQKELKRAGLTEEKLEEGAEEEKGVSSRWMRMLGRRKQDG